MSSVPPLSTDGSDYFYSYGVRETVELTVTIAPHNTWDAFIRRAYDAQNRLIQAQANALVKRGNILVTEARHLVEQQRNRLVLETRSRLSPPGRLYSELLKPGNSLPTLKDLVARKGTIEAVMRSVGKTREVVNRYSMVWRALGPALIAVDIAFVAVVITQAPAESRGRVAARETGGVVGGIGGGVAGAWAGCASAAALASPSLLIPLVGEVTTGGACLAGGIVGGIGAGWLGRTLGKAGGEALYDFVTDFKWTIN